MQCPKCGWHTHEPRRSVDSEWKGCIKYEWSTLHCEKLFCSGKSVSNKVVVKSTHAWKDYHVVDRQTNATIRYETKCTKCKEIKYDD
jgi:hypothetical protein